MPPKKKAANGYKFAEPLPKGTILVDLAKKKWRLGISVGKGGFGEIYSAQEESSKDNKYPYVVKIEPHSNGPLFVEINFYIRYGKIAEVENFMKEKGLKSFGMPIYYGSGSHEYKNEKYRFLVVDKFGTDLYKLYINNNKVFPTDTVFKLGIQILDVLEYIHQTGYVHADIKAANLLMSCNKDTKNKQVYLVDFGLATKYTTNKEFKPNPKKAHDGTIEYLSRDAHQGVQTRRGDLEILAYNLIHWLGCKLPWEDNLQDPKIVQKSKEENMSTVPNIIKACFSPKAAPKAVVDFLTYLKTLKFDTEPDYQKIKTIFTAGVKEANGKIGTVLQFSGSQTPSQSIPTPLSNSRSARNKRNKDKDESTNLDNEAETPKKKRTRKPKKDLVQEEENSDVEMVNVGEESNNEATPVAKQKPRSKKAATNKRHQEVSNNNEVTTTNDAEYEPPSKKSNKTKKYSNEKIPKAKTSSKIEKQHNSDDDVSDAEMVSDTEFVTRTRRYNKTSEEHKNKTNLGKSQSVGDLVNGVELEGCTEAMKEIILKRLQKGVTKKKTKTILKKTNLELTEEQMPGYTDEMKAVALKIKSKNKGKKNAAKPVRGTKMSKAPSMDTDSSEAD